MNESLTGRRDGSGGPPGDDEPHGRSPGERGSGVGREVAFGPSVLVAAVAVLVLLLAAVLPWTARGATGWQVVLGASEVGALPRLFGLFAVVFGVLASAVALLTRRWAAVFVAAAGCGVTSVTGLWAVWSLNTVPGAGPGAGLVVALVAIVVLAGRWAGYALSRT